MAETSGVTTTAAVREREETRQRAVKFYLDKRVAGAGHADAFYATMHEIRALSEDDLWTWIKGYYELTDLELPADFPRKPPSEEAAAAVDDPETASAPEDGRRWEFDETVTAAFDDMLQRSIPNYEDMRRVVTEAAVWHMERIAGAGLKQPLCVDLGASRGSGLAPIVDAFGVRGTYLAVEQSLPMLDALRQRFEGWESAGALKVLAHDLREGYPTFAWGGAPAVVLSVLTLQFVPIEYRQQLLWAIRENLRPGGALILVEKVLGATAELEALETDLYYGRKRAHGYSQEAIQRKRMSLEGVLVPLPAAVNEQFLLQAGFDAVDCVWAWCNFRGWIAIKR